MYNTQIFENFEAILTAFPNAAQSYMFLDKRDLFDAINDFLPVQIFVKYAPTDSAEQVRFEEIRIESKNVWQVGEMKVRPYFYFSSYKKEFSVLPNIERPEPRTIHKQYDAKKAPEPRRMFKVNAKALQAHIDECLENVRLDEIGYQEMKRAIEAKKAEFESYGGQWSDTTLSGYMQKNGLEYSVRHEWHTNFREEIRVQYFEKATMLERFKAYTTTPPTPKPQYQ